MTKDDALGRVAAILAWDTFSHMKAAREMPSLGENSKEVANNNRAAMVALGGAPQYDGFLSLLSR